MKTKSVGNKRRTALKSTQHHSEPPTNLADALFSTTQQRVLALIFGQPERSFFTGELIDLAKTGSGGVQRELQRLADSGLVTVSKIGNQKHFQANHVAPLFQELRSIVRKTFGLVSPLRAALAPIAERIRFAAIYGSVAKRADTASSDLDLLIVSDDLALERIYDVLGGVERELGRKINLNIYTTQEFRQRRNKGNSFIAKVLGGEHIVLIGDERGTAAA